MNCFHSWFSMIFSHRLICSLSLLNRASTSGGLGSTMWVMPLSIRNLKRKVSIMQRKLSWKSLWKQFLILSKEALSPITYSSQKSSTICSSHFDKIVLPPFQSMCINCWCYIWLMNNFAIIFELLVECSQGIFRKFLWRILLSLAQDSVYYDKHNF